MSSISVANPISVRLQGVSGEQSAPAATTRLRITTRGRRVLALLAAAPLAAGIAFSVLAGGSALASGEQAEAVAFETIIVMPGDTLWGIAASVAPTADPRQVVDEIIRLNNLPGGTIQSGSELAIPVAYAG